MLSERMVGAFEIISAVVKQFQWKRPSGEVSYYLQRYNNEYNVLVASTILKSGDVPIVV